MFDRRKFIAAAGTATIGSIAGCSGDGESEPDIETTDGPAEFAVYDASLSEGDTVSVDSETTLDIVIGNRGGEPGEIEAEAVITSLESQSAPRQTASVSTVEEEVASGDTVTVTTETVGFAYAGRYEVTAADASEGTLPVDDEADAEIEVEPTRAPTGESQEAVEDLRVTVDDVSFEQALHYDVSQSVLFGTRERVGVESTLSDQTLVLVNLTVENAGSSGLAVDTENFTFAGESALTDVGGSSLGDVLDVEDSPLHGESVNPGSRLTGWIPFRTPKEAVSDADLSYHRDSTSAPVDAVWELDVGDVGFPEFELVNVDVPDERAEGFQEFAFTVANTGDDVGTFRGEIEWREGTSGDWEGLLEGNRDLAARIPAGEEVTVTSGSDNDELNNTYEYRFNPFGATFVVGPSE